MERRDYNNGQTITAMCHRGKKMRLWRLNREKMPPDYLNAGVYEPEHTMILILEAESAEKAMAFAEPFLKVGRLTIGAGATCEQVAEHVFHTAAASVT